MERFKVLRNVAIIVALACIVWLVPGGGRASTVVSNLLSVLMLAGLSFFAFRMYMEHRVSLFTLEDRLRVVLYASFGLMLLTIVATSRMWDEGGPYALLWFALLGFAAYGVYYVFRATREY